MQFGWLFLVLDLTFGDDLLNEQLSDRSKRVFLALRKRMVLLVAELAVFAIAIVAVVNNANAWEVSVRETEQNSASVVSDYDDTYATYTSYVYNIKANDPADLVTKHDFVRDEVVSIELPQYDLIFLSRNKYTPGIIRIALTGEQYLAKSGTITLQLTRDTSLDDDFSQGRLNNYFSSVMRFSAFIDKNVYDQTPLNLYNNAYEKMYETAHSATTNTDFSKVFTTAVGDRTNMTVDKVSLISLTLSYDEDDWNGDVLNVYLFLTYDEHLTHQYNMSTGIDTDSQVLGLTTKLDNDLYSLRVMHFE